MNRLPLLVIRPEPGNSATLAAARALGLTAWGEPLFRIVPRDWRPPPPEKFDALLIGSANALRHGGRALSNYQKLPAYVIGKATAAAARDAGFPVAGVGTGGLQELARRTSTGQQRQVLRLAGAEHVPIDSGNDAITTIVVYKSLPLPMSTTCASRLGAGAVVLLHSAAAARHFSSECARLRIDRAVISLACIGPRVAEAAGYGGWAAIASADRPDDTALLALARQMCQNASFGDTDDND